MSFALDSDQELFRDTIRDFLSARSDEAEVRRLMETELGYDPATWNRLSAEIGLPGLAVPEEYGGAGFSLIEVGIALEEMGAALACTPFFATAVAAQVVLHSDDEEARKRFLPDLATGRTATLALSEDGGRWDADSVELAATRGGGGEWTLDGHKSLVVDGHTAELILAVARTSDGIGVFAVEADAAGLVRRPLQSFDRTRKLARIEFDATPATPVGSARDGAELVERSLRIARAALAMEQVGGAQRAFDMALDYVKMREQFGRKIGSFQAIKHRLADNLVRLEAARATAYHAIRSAAELADDLPVAAALAKTYCADTFAAIAAENIQLHGGIGFTWEHPAHLYYRRAKSGQTLLGDRRHHRELLAEAAGLTASGSSPTT